MFIVVYVLQEILHILHVSFMWREFPLGMEGCLYLLCSSTSLNQLSLRSLNQLSFNTTKSPCFMKKVFNVDWLLRYMDILENDKYAIDKDCGKKQH